MCTQLLRNDLFTSDQNETLDTERMKCSEYLIKKMSSLSDWKILNRLIKKKNLPTMRLKIVKYINNTFLD